MNLFCSTLFFLLCFGAANAQFLDPDYATKMYNYKDCAAIIYRGNLLVNEYSPKGICKLEGGMEGTLSVAAVKMSEAGASPTKKIGFKVAIKNARTNTLWMFSEETLQEVLIEDLLEKCEPEDRIIIMTVDQQYSLPHHEIEVRMGC